MYAWRLMENKKFVDLYLYYILIGVLSFVALVFLPFFGSEVGMEAHFPNTWIGWIVYIVQQALMAIINILIFHSFICQAYINVKDNENYIKARDIFHSLDDKEYIPMTLQQFNKREYGRKGATIFLGTLLGGFALTQAILSYDYVRMLAYLFTIILGIFFGIYEMKKYEEYLTYEYLQSALYYQKQKEKEREAKEREEALQAEAERPMEMVEKELDKQVDDTTNLYRGITVLESTDSNRISGNLCESVVLDSVCNDICVLGNTTTSDTDTTSVYIYDQENN